MVQLGKAEKRPEWPNKQCRGLVDWEHEHDKNIG